MGFSVKYYAVHNGCIYRLPAKRIDDKSPVLPDLAGQIVKEVTVLVYYKNRTPVEIYEVWLNERPVSVDGVIDLTTLTKAELKRIDASLVGKAILLLPPHNDRK